MKKSLLWASVIAVIWCSFAIADNSKIPQRSDIAAQYKWKLEDIYPDTLAWQADFNRLQSQMGSIGAFEGKLGQSSENLYQCLSLRDSLNNILDRIYVYANLKQDEDTRISQYQEIADRASNLSTHLNEATSFIRPEIVAIPNATLENFLATNDKLKLYDFYIKDIIRTKAHILSPDQESLLANARMATRGPSNIFDMIDNADIKFPIVKDEHGNNIQLTHERYYKILESPDRRVRYDASKAYNGAYLNYINTLGATLAASVNDDWFMAETRKYKTTLEHDLDSDSIPVSVFDNLVKTVNANLAPLHKWVSIRKRVLKLDKIYPYDLDVPLARPAKLEFPYDSAVVTVETALAPLGPQYVSDYKNGINSGWVDVYETEGKTSGAFSWGAYSTHPYVLLNYNNSLDNFSTVAHEMGHAMHSFYTHKSQPYVYEGYATFVAEVASTTNEALLINYLLGHAKTKNEKIYLLTFYIQQIIGTFYTQVMFSEFEKAIHDQVEQDGALSAESMRKIYRDIYQKYWGPELNLETWNDIGGLRIPHFYNSYYV
ncbi:MAG TPA: oligoendopeptidase F, partial [candidate division Zixibacteria bacterium]|nr:oligoendopeptidase F [candidate division Zixibacteria bacterium]